MYVTHVTLTRMGFTAYSTILFTAFTSSFIFPIAKLTFNSILFIDGHLPTNPNT